MTTALDALLGWESLLDGGALATALPDAGIHLSSRQTRTSLKLMGICWQRPARPLAPKQDPAKVERAKARLPVLKERPPKGAWPSPTSDVAFTNYEEHIIVKHLPQPGRAA